MGKGAETWRKKRERSTGRGQTIGQKMQRTLVNHEEKST